MRDDLHRPLFRAGEVGIQRGRAAHPRLDAVLLGEVGLIESVVVDPHVLQHLHGHAAVVLVVEPGAEDAHQRDRGRGAHGNPEEQARPARPGGHLVHDLGFGQA